MVSVSLRLVATPSLHFSVHSGCALFIFSETAKLSYSLIMLYFLPKRLTAQFAWAYLQVCSWVADPSSAVRIGIIFCKGELVRCYGNIRRGEQISSHCISAQSLLSYFLGCNDRWSIWRWQDRCTSWQCMADIHRSCHLGRVAVFSNYNNHMQFVWVSDHQFWWLCIKHRSELNVRSHAFHRDVFR